MNIQEREDLEREAADIRERLLHRAEELERISTTRPISHHQEEPDPEVSVSDDSEPEERRRLERRADRVRERLANSVDALERKARERLLPIVVGGAALMVVLTAGYAWMFYRTMKLSRRSIFG